jgi:hypothetical protein
MRHKFLFGTTLIILIITGCGKQEGSSDNPVQSSTAWNTKNNSPREKIIGTWLCPNNYGYVQRIIYQAGGHYIEYEMGYSPGYASDNVEFTGAWSITGNTLTAGKYGYEHKVEFSGNDTMYVTLKGAYNPSVCKRET